MYWNNTAEFVIFLMRIGFGWLLAWDGYTKIATPNWSILSSIEFAHSFPVLYAWMAHPAHVGLVSLLFSWALLLVGISLILGLWIRFFGFVGIGLMLLYYFVNLQFPHIVGGGYIVDQYVIYSLILLLLILVRSGNFWGLDSRVEVRMR